MCWIGPSRRSGSDDDAVGVEPDRYDEDGLCIPDKSDSNPHANIPLACQFPAGYPTMVWVYYKIRRRERNYCCSYHLTVSHRLDV